MNLILAEQRNTRCDPWTRHLDAMVPETRIDAGFVSEGSKNMSPMHIVVLAVLLLFFCLLAPVGIYVFAKCFTGRGWTFMDYNPDEHP